MGQGAEVEGAGVTVGAAVARKKETYHFLGRRTESGRAGAMVVFSNGTNTILPERTDLKDYHPDSYDWGFDGRGSRQLALAMLAHFFGPHRGWNAMKLHQAFNERVIAKLDRKRGWKITPGNIAQVLREIADAERAGRA